MLLEALPEECELSSCSTLQRTKRQPLPEVTSRLDLGKRQHTCVGVQGKPVLISSHTMALLVSLKKKQTHFFIGLVPGES